MNYLSPSPTATNKTYAPHSESGSICALYPPILPQKKKKKIAENGKRKMENTKKVVPLGDEMWICVHLFARFEMSDKHLAFNATASLPFLQPGMIERVLRICIFKSGTVIKTNW